MRDDNVTAPVSLNLNVTGIDTSIAAWMSLNS